MRSGRGSGGTSWCRWRPEADRARPRGQRGVALLLALVVLALVATAAAGMVWQQSRAVRIEAAARAQAQAGWVMLGALDWARQILRDDLRAGDIDHLGEPWATPLAEARLSDFLSADPGSGAGSDLPEVFLSGRITDAQSHYNLRNLIGEDGTIIEAELAGLRRLCAAAGLPGDTARRLAEGLRAARAPSDEERRTGAPIPPGRVPQLAWLGLNAATIARLHPLVVLLPARTPVNVNTAPRQVLVAAIDDLDLGTAEHLVQLRDRNPFASAAALQRELPVGVSVDPARIGVRSSHFEVHIQLRADGRLLEEDALLQRRGSERGGAVVALARERHGRIGP